MWPAVIASSVAILVVAWGTRRFLQGMRSARAEPLPVRELGRTASALSDLAFFLAVGAMPFLLAFWAGTSWAIVPVRVLLVLAVILWASAGLVVVLTRAPVDASLSVTLQDRSTGAWRAARLLGAAWLRRMSRHASAAWRRVVPPSVGWTEISRTDLSRSLGVRAHLVYYGAVLLLLPAFVVIGLLAAYGRGGEVERAFFGAFFGFNSLLIGTAVIVPFLAMSLILSMLHLVGVLAFAPDFGLALKRFMGAIGGGTAVGAVAAMILPLFSAYLPAGVEAEFLRDGPGGTGGLEFPTSPGLLLQLPAIGAVVGLFVGVPLALIAIGNRARNRLVAIFSGPLLFGLLSAGGVALGVAPRNLFEMMVENSAAGVGLPDVDCADERSLMTASEGPAGTGDGIAYVMAQCVDDFIVSDGWLLGVVLAAIGLVALAALVLELRTSRPGHGRASGSGADELSRYDLDREGHPN